MEKKNPAFEPKINIPETIKILKNFKNGTNAYGEWHGWEVQHEGVTKTFFPNDKVHQDFLQFVGQDVVIRKEEKEKEGGGHYFLWHVGQSLFDEGGKPSQPPTPKIERLVTAYEQVFEAIRILVDERGHSPEYFNAEVVQKLATTLYIER